MLLLQQRRQCWMHELKAVAVIDSTASTVPWNSLSVVSRQLKLGAPALKVDKLWLQ